MALQGKLVGVGTALVVLLATWYLLAPPSTPVPPIAADASGVAAPATAHAPAGETTTEPPLAREPAPPAWTPPVLVNWPGESVPVAGIVLDLDGHGVPDVPITRERVRLSPEVRTDRSGHFAGVHAGGGTFGVDDERWIAVLVPMLYDAEPHDDLTIVVAPCARVAGAVVDATGEPIAGVRVRATGGQVVRERFARVLDRCADAWWQVTTAADGAFAHARVPLVDAARITFVAPGYRSLVLPTAVAREQQRFVLERTFAGDTLTGVVVDDDDAPVRLAVVSLHDVSVTADANGAFRLELWKVGELPAGASAELVATGPSRLPGRLSCASPAWRTRAAWPAELRVRIGGVPERIRGRLLRADGTPCANPTPKFVAPEPAHAGEPAPGEPVATTPPIDREAGEFETAAVAPGRHRLWFVDPETLDLLVTEELPTGAPPVTLMFPDRGHWPPLRGVVVDRRGAPVANADWQLERDDPLPGAKHARAGQWGHASREGRIDGAPPSRDAHTLCVKDDGASDWVRIPLASLPRVDDFRLVVPVRCRTRVDLMGAWSGVDRGEFADAAGAVSEVVFTTATMAYGVGRFPLVDGRSRMFTALDDAVELRLFQGERKVGALPVALLRGSVNVVRP